MLLNSAAMYSYLWVVFIVIGGLSEVITGYKLSDWMANLPIEITNFPLTDIAIPGSHDSATYSLNTDSDIFLQELQEERSAIGKYLQNQLHAGNSSRTLNEIIYHWSKTQDLNITEQLHYGIRYLDLRVVYNSMTTDVHIMHGLLGTTLLDVLLQISKFISEHSKEIIILDFNHVYVSGDSKSRHSFVATSVILQKLRNILTTRLCQIHKDRYKNLVIKDIWKVKCQVISLLTEKQNKRNSMEIKSPFSYTKFLQKSQWIHFLDSNYQKEKEPNTFYVTQGIMQPHWMEVVVAGLSEKATLKEWVSKDATNDIVEWLHNKKIGKLHGINIVIADFVEFQNFTEKVVELNFAFSCSPFYSGVDRLLIVLHLAMYVLSILC